MGIASYLTTQSRWKFLFLCGGVFVLSILTLHLFFNVLSFDSHMGITVASDSSSQDHTPIAWDTIHDDSPLNVDPSHILPSSSFNFSASPTSLPAWMRTPLSTPFVLRLGIISRPSAFARRKAIREYILAHLPSSEVHIHHRFVVGYTGTLDDARIAKERALYGDILVLDMPENERRLGEKRWRMLRWAAEAPGPTYDYYMSADTDSFVRITALARRLMGMKPELGKPRETSVMWGSMGKEHMHYLVSPDEEEKDPEVQDDLAPSDPGNRQWFQYPYGFAIILSSHLVDRLVRPGLVLPHHVHYPFDDVVIGNWVNDFLRQGEGDSEEGEAVKIVDDHPGFHDPPGHSWNESSTLKVSYDSVVIHHMSIEDMRGVRMREEFRDGWVKGLDE